MTISFPDQEYTFATICVDIGKGVFHIVGFDSEGRITLSGKIKRLVLVKAIEGLPRSIVGDACLRRNRHPIIEI